MFFRKETYSYRSAFKRVFAAWFDFLGYCVSALVRLFRPHAPLSVPQRILIIRNDQLGDYLLTRPAIHALRSQCPGAKMDILIANELIPLAETEGLYHEIIPFRESWFPAKDGPVRTVRSLIRLAALLKTKRYDLAVDFRGDLRNILLMFFSGIPVRLGFGITGGGFLLTECPPFPCEEHQVMAGFRLLKTLGVKIPDKVSSPPFYATEPEKLEFSAKWLSLIEQPHPWVVIHPGAGYPSKRWPAARYLELSQRIAADGRATVILIGTRNELDLFDSSGLEPPAVWDLRGKTSLKELLTLFSHADFYVGNDSGPAHLAAAQGMELVILFSAVNDARKWHPWTGRLRLVKEDVPCSPCEQSICPLGHHDCMRKISVETVWDLLGSMLAQSRKDFSR